MAKMYINRRKFIGALGMGTAHLLFSNRVHANSNRVYSSNPLQKISLGNTGIETTLIGIGTGVHATNRSSFLTRQDQEKSIEVIRHAYRRGIRNFDLADTYGTHPLMAQALKSMERNKVTLTSKIWVRPGGIPENERPDADAVVDRFRQELNTDYLDLVQIHCMVDNNWTDSQKRQMDLLETLKARGIIRAHGVSVHSLNAMKAALNSSWVDVVHCRINPYGIAMDKPNPEEVVEVIHQLHNAGKGVIGMKLIGNGKLRNDSKKIDNTLRFVLGLQSVDMMIIGFENTEQIDNYIDRVSRVLQEINEG